MPPTRQNVAQMWLCVSLYLCTWPRWRYSDDRTWAQLYRC